MTFKRLTDFTNLDINNLIDMQALNTRMVEFVKGMQSQFGLGVFYMWFAVLNTIMIERGINGGIVSLSHFMDINPYWFVVLSLLFSVYCFIRDRLPIHYVLGATPIGLYGVYVLFATLTGNLLLQGLLATLAYVMIPYFAVVGVVNRWELKSAMQDINQLKSELHDIKELASQRHAQPD